MPARRTPRFTPEELAILREHYPLRGAAVAELLPGRSVHAIRVKASRLGLHVPPARSNAHSPKPKLSGDDLEQAIRLREDEGWSFERIGAHFGVAEAAATNAVLIALCPRKGFTAAERDHRGCLTEAGMERVRYALKKGLKGVDIQLRLGVSASCVAEQRRRYNAELKARGKAPLPAPGGGDAYSGVKLSRDRKSEVEALFMQGLGTLKVSERTGVSKTSCTRIRARLVRRLRRKGEVLPGCDAKGRRHVQAESARFVTDGQRQALRALLLDAVPVARAAKLCAIGACSAYRIRDALAAELAREGQALPEPQWRTGPRRKSAQDRYWPPDGTKEIYAFRALLRTMPFDEAKARWRADRREEHLAELRRPRTFEEQLARVAAGELGITAALPRQHLEPQKTAA